MLRRLMLRLSENKQIDHFVRARGMSRGFARRFVAGESLAEAVDAVRKLNGEGILASLDFLGERVTQASVAGQVERDYLRMLETIQASGLQCDVSLKLTQLGLDIAPSVAHDNMRQILACAQRLANFVRIDMESSGYVDRTLALFRSLHDEFSDTVGAVIQAYLRRSASDVAQLMELRPNVRICKGAYREPAEVALPRKPDVDRNFVELMGTLLRQGGYTAIATHDEQMIREAKELIRANGIARDRFEFEMLYGIRRDLQLSLVREGYRVRVYVPYGICWYPYFMRRLGERPANVWFVVKNLLRE